MVAFFFAVVTFALASWLFRLAYNACRGGVVGISNHSPLGLLFVPSILLIRAADFPFQRSVDPDAWIWNALVLYLGLPSLVGLVCLVRMVRRSNRHYRAEDERAAQRAAAAKAASAAKAAARADSTRPGARPSAESAPRPAPGPSSTGRPDEDPLLHRGSPYL